MIFFIKRKLDPSEASTRLRLLLVANFLSEKHIAVKVSSSVFHWYKSGDVIILSKELSRSYIFAAYLLAKILALKIILDVCENYLEIDSKHRANFILASKLADTIIVPSNYLRKRMNSLGFTNVVYIDDLIEVSSHQSNRSNRCGMVWFGAWRENFGLEDEDELKLWFNLIHEFLAIGATLSIITDDVIAAQNFFDGFHIPVNVIKWSVNNWPEMLRHFDCAFIPNGKTEIARSKSYNRITTSLNMGLTPIVSDDWVNGYLAQHVITVSAAISKVNDIHKDTLSWDHHESELWNKNILVQWGEILNE